MLIQKTSLQPCHMKEHIDLDWREHGGTRVLAYDAVEEGFGDGCGCGSHVRSGFFASLSYEKTDKIELAEDC